MRIDEDKLNNLLGRMVAEFGGLASARDGGCRADGGGSVQRTHTTAPALRAGVAQCASSERLRRLRPGCAKLQAFAEAAQVLADDTSPAFMGGGSNA
nr:hypothetical protein [Variovorax sp. YR216]